jgi:hypothetical protein
MQRNRRRPAALARGEPCGNDLAGRLIFPTNTPPTPIRQSDKLRRRLADLRRASVMLDACLDEIEADLHEGHIAPRTSRLSFCNNADDLLNAIAAVVSAVFDFEDQEITNPTSAMAGDTPIRRTN